MLQDKASRDLFDAFETMDKYLLDVLPKSGCLASDVLGVADGGDMCDVCLLRQGARAEVGLVLGHGFGLGLGHLFAWSWSCLGHLFVWSWSWLN